MLWAYEENTPRKRINQLGSSSVEALIFVFLSIPPECPLTECPCSYVFAFELESMNRLTFTVILLEAPTGIFGVSLQASIKYANVAISLSDERGESFIYGYVPIVVAKCGVFLKEKGCYHPSSE